jgi:hypothetical protein
MGHNAIKIIAEKEKGSRRWADGRQKNDGDYE